MSSLSIALGLATASDTLSSQVGYNIFVSQLLIIFIYCFLDRHMGLRTTLGLALSYREVGMYTAPKGLAVHNIIMDTWSVHGWEVINI